MSGIHQSDPPTNGKVVLNTTLGAIDIELWTKEAPKATRNFVQLCLDGFYNGSKFFRVITNFIAQTGDPSNTGHGDNRTYLPNDETFANEIHSRLRFGRRGLVCCAGIQNDSSRNANQFFFTLDKTPELEKKHTIFGKVVGNSIFNLLSINEMELEQGSEDKLAEPPVIISADVVWNPFDDLFPRESAIQKAALEASNNDADAQKKKKSGARAIKNFGLLSFGDEAEDDEAVFSSTVEKVTVAPSKSKQKAKSSSKRFSDEENEEEEKSEAQGTVFKKHQISAQEEDEEWQRQLASKAKEWNKAEKKAERRDARMEERLLAKKRAMRGKTESDSDEESFDEEGRPTYRTRKEGEKEDIDAPKFKKRKLEEVTEEEEKNSKFVSPETSLASKKRDSGPSKQEATSTKKPSAKEESILAKLAAFKTKISDPKQKSSQTEEDDWKSAPLVFDESLEQDGDMQRDMKRDDYVVYDPSERKEKRSPPRSESTSRDDRDRREGSMRRGYSPRRERSPRSDDREQYGRERNSDRRYERGPSRDDEYRGSNDRHGYNNRDGRDSRRYEEGERRGGFGREREERYYRQRDSSDRYDSGSRRNERY